MIKVEISLGELIDKITILDIKQERIADPAKLKNIRAELGVLEAAEASLGLKPDALGDLKARLKDVNAEIWELEDTIRDCERAQDFGDRFITTARLIYRTNDRRAALKRDINVKLGSAIVEEKSYQAY